VKVTDQERDDLLAAGALDWFFQLRVHGWETRIGPAKLREYLYDREGMPKGWGCGHLLAECQEVWPSGGKCCIACGGHGR
jgi:hypothetical protein